MSHLTQSAVKGTSAAHSLQGGLRTVGANGFLNFACVVTCAKDATEWQKLAICRQGTQEGHRATAKATCINWPKNGMTTLGKG